MESSDDEAPESEGEKFTDSLGIIKKNLSTNTEVCPSNTLFCTSVELLFLSHTSCFYVSRILHLLKHRLKVSQVQCMSYFIRKKLTIFRYFDLFMTDLD